MISLRAVFAVAGTALLALASSAHLPASAFTKEESLFLARDAYNSLRSGDLEEAVTKYGGAIDSRMLPPEALGNALLNRALAWQQLGQHKDAISDYSAALNIDAMSPSLRATALYNRGLSHHRMRALPLAIEDYTSALLLNAELPQAFMSRGQALRESGQLLFALSDFERAINFGHPDPGRVHHLLGLTFEQLNRKSDAKLHYQIALDKGYRDKALELRLAALATFGSRQPAEVTANQAQQSLAPETNIVRHEAATAIEPPAELLAEARVKMPKPVTAVADPVTPIGNTAPTIAPEASYETTGSTTPAPEVARVAVPPTIETVPEIPPKATVITPVEAVGPETPAVDTVAVASLPQDEVAKVVDRPVAITGGWVIQFASASSEEGAKSTWSKMQKKHKTLKDIAPVFVRADLGKKGVVYRVRLAGFDLQDMAKQECSRFKASGVDCFVSKATN